MITKNIKKISSILEIIILYSIFIYIFFKTFKNYSILSIKHSFINLEEKDPTLISINQLANSMGLISAYGEMKILRINGEEVGDYYIVYRTRDRKVLKSINYFRPDLDQFFTKEELINV